VSSAIEARPVAIPPEPPPEGVPGGRKWDQWICLASIPAFYTLFGIVFVILTRLMPPPAPTKSPAHVADWILGHRTSLQVGLVILFLSIGLSTMTTGLVVVQMRRMTGAGRWLAFGYLGALAVAVLPGCLFCGLMYALAAFRPDRPVAIMSLLYDAGMISFVGSLGCFIGQYLTFVIAVFRDRNQIFPLWFGYWSIWAGVTEIVAAPAWIYRTGPFAWNGLLAFYQGTVIWVSWQIGLTVLLFRAIRRQEREESFDPAVADVPAEPAPAGAA
jgi:hypothetical protein